MLHLNNTAAPALDGSWGYCGQRAESMCDCVLSGCGWCPSDLTCRPATDRDCGACFAGPQTGECVDVEHALPLVASGVLLVLPAILWFVYARLWRLRHSDWAFSRSGEGAPRLSWLCPQARLACALAAAPTTSQALAR